MSVILIAYTATSVADGVILIFSHVLISRNPMGIFKSSMEFSHPQILLFCDAMDVRDRLHPEEMAGDLLLCTPLLLSVLDVDTNQL